MKVHFLGIGGSGASAAAAIAQAQGYEVTGCDLSPHNEFTAGFHPNQLYQGHSAQHLASHSSSGNVDLLAVTPAVFSLNPDNEEVRAAKDQGIPVLTWQQFMGEYLQKGKFVIAVSGTHGKSTITAMIGCLLEDAGLDPTVETGAIIPRWGKNYRIGKSKPVLSEVLSPSKDEVEGYFVAEADEFNDNFLSTIPNIAIVTTVEYDHPEYFKNFEVYKDSFRRFLCQTKQKIFANLFDRGVQEVLASQEDVWEANVVDYSKRLIDFSLQIQGQYNILNASAAYQVGLELGIKPEIIKKSLSSFTGAARRFEKVGEYQGSLVYSDFGHHPTEIKVTLEAAREKFPDKKITVVFQPHMFSRTKALFGDFIKVLKETPVDQILIMDIYPSREVDTGLVSSKELVEAIDKESVEFVPTEEAILEKVKNTNSDVLFFLGAGDVDKIAKRLVNE